MAVNILSLGIFLLPPLLLLLHRSLTLGETERDREQEFDKLGFHAESQMQLMQCVLLNITAKEWRLSYFLKAI